MIWPPRGDETFGQQLGIHPLEQRFRCCFANAVLERPDGRAARDIDRLAQTAKALIAHAVEQLVFHLLIRQVVERLEHHDARHRLGRKRRPTTLRTDHARSHKIHCSCQCREVDASRHLDQRVAKRVDLASMRLGCKTGRP